MKEIKNYEVAINESNARAAFIVNENENILETIKDKTLEYIVDFKAQKVNIYIKDNNEPVFVFINANEDVLRYAYKSNGIPLAIGTITTKEPQIVYETYVECKS